MLDKKAGLVGKTYDHGTWALDAAAFTAYADATNDANPRYQGPSAVAPPLYHVHPMIGLMMKMATDPELDIDLLRLVHGEHAMRFVRPLRSGETLKLCGALLSAEQKASGRVLAFSLLGDVGDERVLEGRTSYFIRAKNPAASGSKRSKAKVELPEPDWTSKQPVSVDQPRRYADASGDHNAIHLDEAVAKGAGLPGVILHGLCSMAFASRDIVDRECGGDPGALKFLSVRFARPVFPGTTLTLQTWRQDGDTLQFQTVGPDGKPVIVGGKATVESNHE